MASNWLTALPSPNPLPECENPVGYLVIIHFFVLVWWTPVRITSPEMHVFNLFAWTASLNEVPACLCSIEVASETTPCCIPKHLGLQYWAWALGYFSIMTGIYSWKNINYQCTMDLTTKYGWIVLLHNPSWISAPMMGSKVYRFKSSLVDQQKSVSFASKQF